MSLVLRFMRYQDKPELARLLDAISQFKRCEIEVAQELIDAYLKQGIKSGYHVLVAEENEIISGYICYGPSPLTESTWDIYWEAVSPSRQGYGMGSCLIAEAEKNIRALGGKMVLVETSSTRDYENTRKFYITNGYRQVSCISDYYAPADDRLTYLKNL